MIFRIFSSSCCTSSAEHSLQTKNSSISSQTIPVILPNTPICSCCICCSTFLLHASSSIMPASVSAAIKIGVTLSSANIGSITYFLSSLICLEYATFRPSRMSVQNFSTSRGTVRRRLSSSSSVCSSSCIFSRHCFTRCFNSS